MMSRFRKLSSNSFLVRSAQRLCLVVLPAMGLSCWSMAAPVPTLKPISALMTQVMARAVAVDVLISQVQQRLRDPHPLELELVTVGGLGPIRLGMSIQEAANAAQVSFVAAPLTQSEECKYYLPEGYDKQNAVRTVAIDGIGLMVVNDQIIRIDIWPDSPVKTRSELGIGATIEQLKTAYEGQLETTPHPYTDGNYLTLTPDASGSNLYSLVFETDKNGIVSQFRTGQLPAVTWTEGCS
ncbi:MAG: hypothetical protein F6K31_33685 [Symploca sp. SIO2G7]|nr:hypothetical protein [Symploca sp. SIO2G7]